LLNEPIAPYFSNKDDLNAMLEPLYKRAVAEIRKVDTNHIVILGAPQWNSNFTPFSDWKFDNKIMYSCHRYGGEATTEAINHFIEFRNKTNLPMYMGEIGHNTTEWMETFCKVMEENNIGYTFWPYKKMAGSCFVSIGTPDQWELVVNFSEAPRDTYAAIREARPNQELSRQSMMEFLTLCLFENCSVEEDYINALRLNKERTDN